MERETDAAVLLDLYRDAMALPPNEFQASAAGMLRRMLRFQSSIWGSGYIEGVEDAEGRLVPLQVYTDRIDPEGFEQWKVINRADKVIPITMARPGRTHAFHAPTLFRDKADGVMRDYARRFGRQSYLITAFGAPGSTVREWCSLYRPDPDDQFSAAERARCEVLVGHIRQALEVNARLTAVGQGTAAYNRLDDEVEHTAMATPSGRLVSAQAGFTLACAAQWREFDGRQLPARVMNSLLQCAGVVRLAKFTLASRPMAGMLWLRLQVPRTPAPLPPRRHDIALLFAEGRSTKEIAQTLGLAHATVRNQLVSAYRTLGVSTRAALRARLKVTPTHTLG